MAKTTRTGFDFSVKGFLPFDPQYMFDHGIDPRKVSADLKDWLAERGMVDVEVVTKWRARKKKSEPEPVDDIAGSDMPHAAE